MINVFVICTGNSCRSVLGEALFNHFGSGRIQAFSAGSHPKGRIKPKTLATLQRHGLPTQALKSQSWDEFADQPMDIVITVCDNVASETCPVYLNNAIRVHWGLAEPNHFENTESEIVAALEKTYWILKQRINKMLALPLESMSPEELTNKLNSITEGTSSPAEG